LQAWVLVLLAISQSPTTILVFSLNIQPHLGIWISSKYIGENSYPTNMFLNTNTHILLLYIEVSIYIYWFNTSSHSLAWHDHVYILLVDLVVVVVGNSIFSSMLSTSVHVMRLNHIGPNSVGVFTNIYIPVHSQGLVSSISLISFVA